MNSIETMEERQDKVVKEYIHVISQSEALRVLEARSLVSTKSQNSNILEVKEHPPCLKQLLLRKQMRPPDLIHIPLYGLKKEKMKRVLRKNERAHRWNAHDLRGRNFINYMYKIKFDFKLIVHTNISLEKSPN